MYRIVHPPSFIQITFEFEFLNSNSNWIGISIILFFCLWTRSIFFKRGTSFSWGTEFFSDTTDFFSGDAGEQVTCSSLLNPDPSFYPAFTVWYYVIHEGDSAGNSPPSFLSLTKKLSCDEDIRSSTGHHLVPLLYPNTDEVHGIRPSWISHSEMWKFSDTARVTVYLGNLTLVLLLSCMHAIKAQIILFYLAGKLS